MPPWRRSKPSHRRVVLSLSTNKITEILQSRYDYYSARAVLARAASHAGIETKGPFDAKAIGSLADALLTVGDRVDEVVAELREAAAAAKGSAKAKPEAEK